MVCEDSSIISLADDGGIELRNYNIYPFNLVKIVLIAWSVKIVLLIIIIVQVCYVLVI
mgnify:FL=1|jgi:hypothetical protein